MQKTLYAGDTLNQAISLAEYPASEGWIHSTRFAPQTPGGTAVTVHAASIGDDYALTVPASTTDQWAPGKWTYSQWVAKGSERKTVATGELLVQANPASADVGLDTRSHVKKTLDALEAMIEGKAGKDVLNYTIAGRSLQHYSLTELIPLRDKYAAAYAAEKAGNSGNPFGGRGRKVHVRF